MKIRYKRSGGFANVKTSVVVDSAKLPQKKAREIQSLVHKAQFFQQPAEITQEPQAPDDLEHEVEITEGGRTHTVRRRDSQSTVELTRLFDRLQKEIKTG